MNKGLAGLIVFVIIFICYLSDPARLQVQQSSTSSGINATSVPVETLLGDRLELVRHFEYVHGITEWQQISNDAFGISEDGLIVIRFRDDPVRYAELGVSTNPVPDIGSAVITDFLSLLLPLDAFGWATEVMKDGVDSEQKFDTVRVKIFRDEVLSKVIFEIENTR